MKTKICSKCRLEKHLVDFKKDSSRSDGMSGQCKACCSEHPSRKWGSIFYFKLRAWGAINKRTVNGSNPTFSHYLKKGIRLEMTKNEFYNWCDDNKEKIQSFFDEEDSPSVDRIDSSKHYSIDNIRIISFSENSSLGVKSHAEMYSVPIIGIGIAKQDLIDFPSMKSAARNGFDWHALYNHLRGKAKYVKGYVFFRKEEFDLNPSKCIEIAKNTKINPRSAWRLANA